MNRTSRTLLSLLFAVLALAAAATAVVGLPRVDAEISDQTAQSTSAILEQRAA